MQIETQLIQLFLWVCEMYDKHSTLKYQRWSNDTTEPLFTDQELITDSVDPNFIVTVPMGR
jgi:hypothetical protein